MNNESGLEFTDISSEKVRKYFKDGMCFCTIKNPLKLHVSKSGGHRVFSSDGTSYYVKPSEGWHIEWKNKEGEPNFVK